MARNPHVYTLSGREKAREACVVEGIKVCCPYCTDRYVHRTIKEYVVGTSLDEDYECSRCHAKFTLTPEYINKVMRLGEFRTLR